MSDSNMHPIVERMMAADNMSQWLGIEVLESAPGVCRCSLEVRDDMVNGFGIAHGAITYALADSTLAFAVNAQGRHAVSVTSRHGPPGERVPAAREEAPGFSG